MAWNLANVPITAQGLDVGAYTIYASAYDAAGNTKSSASRSFTLRAPVAGDAASSSAVAESAEPDSTTVKSAPSS